MCRWFSWFDGAVRLLASWHSMLLVLKYYLLATNVITRAGDLQSRDDIYKKMEELAAAAKAAPKAGARRVRHSNIEVDALRAVSKNQMHLCARIMSNRKVYQVLNLALSFTEPIRRAFGMTSKALHTQEGREEHAFSDFRGDYNRVLADVTASLKSSVLMTRLGFTEPPTAAAAAMDGHDWDMYPYAEENEVAEVGLTILRNLLSQRGMTSCESRWHLPGIFIGLVTDRPVENGQTRHRLRELWDAVCWCEGQQGTTPAFKTLLHRMLWPCSGWIRGLLLALSEYDWDYVPAWVREAIENWSRAVKTTEMEERFFNGLRDHERESKAGQLGSLSSWSYMLGSGELERFDLTAVEPTLASEDIPLMSPWSTGGY